MHDEDLHRRIALIERRMAIQDLRHRYWLSIVQKDHAGIVACYARDAHSEFGFGFDLRGIDTISAFYRKQFDDENLIVQVPLGTNGLIDFVDEDNATGSWLISVSIVRGVADRQGVRNAVRYHEKYRTENGIWKIAYQKTHYLFWETIAVRDSL